jgi:hypothetical protein
MLVALFSTGLAPVQQIVGVEGEGVGRVVLLAVIPPLAVSMPMRVHTKQQGSGVLLVAGQPAGDTSTLFRTLRLETSQT